MTSSFRSESRRPIVYAASGRRYRLDEVRAGARATLPACRVRVVGPVVARGGRPRVQGPQAGGRTQEKGVMPMLASSLTSAGTGRPTTLK